MAVPAHPRVYAIGAAASRLTFLSQQHRALNLIWALRVKGELLPETRVAVVGGGLAGVTAAAGAHLLGAKVTLLERKAEILHLQRGTQLRFIQPNIYDWPDAGSENPFTDLPFFNWGAGMAASVVETILRQWGQIAGLVSERLNHDVRQVRVLPDRTVSLTAEGPIGFRNWRAGAASAPSAPPEASGIYRDVFDLVILAVGFGLERTLSSIPFLSYWENDNLGRAIMTGPLPRHFVVSGCGDGGLIDAIRLRIRDFDHARFVYDLLSFPGIGAIKEQLREIDREAAALALDGPLRARIEAAGPDAPRLLRRKLAERRAEYLSERYEILFSSLRVPDAERITETLRRQLRNDTVVYLNSPAPAPLTLASAILNRVAVFLLCQHGGLRYRAGELMVLSSAVREHVRVAFQREGYPTDELDVHEVIVRHGPESAIARLLPGSIVEQFAPLSTVDDITRSRQYPSEFWSGATLAGMRRRVRMDYAAANFPRALTTLVEERNGNSLTVKVTESGVTYMVASEGGTGGERRSEFDRIPVEYAAPPGGPPPATAAPPRRRPAKTRPLYCGVGIAAASVWRRPWPAFGQLGTGTLGCFVKVASGAVALLTAASTLADAAKVDEEVLQPIRGWRPIAKVVDLRAPIASPAGANLTTGTTVQNEFDAALAALLPGVNGENRFDRRWPVPPIRTLGAPQIGDQVFKVGLGSGLTHGRISSLEVQSEIQEWNGPCWFTNLFAIESVGQAFARAGDSGAVIVREKDGAALGLLIGGSDRTTVASPLGPILTFFGATLLGSEDTTTRATPASRR
jgi:pyridine nucleotide-disulfide oxidoreductase